MGRTMMKSFVLLHFLLCLFPFEMESSVQEIIYYKSISIPLCYMKNWKKEDSEEIEEDNLLKCAAWCSAKLNLCAGFVLRNGSCQIYKHKPTFTLTKICLESDLKFFKKLSQNNLEEKFQIKYFSFNKEPKRLYWSKAKLLCNNINSSLAELTTMAMYTDVKKSIPDESWVGGVQIVTTNPKEGWTWEFSKVPIDPGMWKSDEPNDYQGYAEDKASLSKEGLTDHVDAYGSVISSIYDYVCEIDLFPLL